MWGAVLLTLLRLIQGIGVGGEWGGSVLLAMEWARTTKNRGFLSAWPQFGAPCGLFLANCAVLLFSYLSGDQFKVWGWRIPFLISIVMVGIGMWIRLGISETPVFQRVVAEERVERVPVLEVLKRQPKQLILSALLRLPEQGPGFIVGTFIFTYATTVLGQSRDFVLMAVITQTFIGFIWVVCAGALSDYVGRKNMYMIGAAFMGIFGFIYFAMLNTGIPWVIFVAIAISLVSVMTQYGPEAALIAESSRHGCATAAPRSATNRPRSSPGARRRSSRLAFATFIRAYRSRSISYCCDHRHHRDIDAHGLHQQGYIGGIPRGLNRALPCARGRRLWDSVPSGAVRTQESAGPVRRTLKPPGGDNVYEHPDTNRRVGTRREGSPARHRLGQADRRQSHRADSLAAVSCVHDRHADDRGYAGSVPSTHAGACRENAQRRRAGRQAAGVICDLVQAEHEHPYRAIIETAESKGCDLIVMASHGRHGISAVVLGPR